MVLAIVTYGIDADAPMVEGKFIQLRLRDAEYLVFAPKHLHGFHNQILARFLADRDIEHHWANDQALEFESDSVRVIGGGRFRLDRQARKLELWDSSQAYGRFDERELPQRLRDAGHPWSGYEIAIS